MTAPPPRTSSLRSLSLSTPALSLTLTPLRAHYLKRHLVSLQFLSELTALTTPSSLSLLGPPFVPSSRFQGVYHSTPLPAPTPGSPAALAEQHEAVQSPQLPFLKFVFQHFVLSFPFLVNCPTEMWSGKLQPFVGGFVERNIGAGDRFEDEEGEGEGEKRRKIAKKVEKYLGLVMSAAVKVVENGGKEEVVRVGDNGLSKVGLPASQAGEENSYKHTRGDQTTGNHTTAKEKETKEKEFEINVVSVRNVIVKGTLRNKSHEEFIVRTRRRGMKDIFVARRYGDFTRLAEQLRIDFIEEDVLSPPPKDRRTTDVRVPLSGSSSNAYDVPSPTTSLPPSPTTTSTSAFFPVPPSPASSSMPSLSRERNRLTLRAYLRSLLVNPTLSSSATFRRFLTDAPTRLSDSELRDVELREEMDRIREEEARSFKAEVDGRVAELEAYLRAFREDLVRSDGLSRVFRTIRETEEVGDLPVQYRKVIEWARISLASTIYQILLGSDTSSSVFSQLKRLHSLMPYFLLRGILRISNPIAMVRSMLDLFLARPFGATSLLQKMCSSGLADEAAELRNDAELVARKIGDQRLVDKVRWFVDAKREVQDRMRDEAVGQNQDLMTVILQYPAEPQLDRATLQQIGRASVAYAEYVYAREELSDEDEDEGPDNDDAWLFEDLHVLLRVLTKARDKEQLIELIFEGTTSDLLKDFITIFYEPLAKVYKAANIADCVSDLQFFLNDLIKTVEQAEEANLTDPQKTVQTFVNLVARHESRFYHFVHQVHSKGEGLFDNLMKWIELFINFIRDGLPSPVSLEFLLPHAGKEREQVMDEIDKLVEYHRALKERHYQRMRKRLDKGGGGSDKDKDAAFVQGVMANLRMGEGMEEVVGDRDDDSDEEEDEEDEGSEEDGDGEEGNDPRRRFGSTSTAGSGGLVPLPPTKAGSGAKKRKDKVVIEQPKLVHIPKLVPLFVELVSPQLYAARRIARANPQRPM